MRILRKRVLLGRDRIVLAHDAGDRLGLGHLALFDELLEGAETAATGGHLEEPGLVAPLVTLNADGQRLQQAAPGDVGGERVDRDRSEEHTSELQSLMRISYAVFCLKKKTKITDTENNISTNEHIR